ncbi:hypothetical protein [Pseudomonas fluorescens]|uniref:hypothetical protein n=1 Tax=Pseudomonas fluorescens TaxID=294 RepID=UPI0012DB584E|nr:hypothetical protein [Pseudomonas fluorescens]
MRETTSNQTNNQTGILIAEIARLQKSITYYQLLLSQISMAEKINALGIDLGISYPAHYDYIPRSPAERNSPLETSRDSKGAKGSKATGDTTTTCHTLKMQRGRATAL